MQRTIRYQGAVLCDDHVLLIQHRHHTSGHSYWLLPGGGLEGDETPEAFVQREVREETHLLVEVGQHLLDDPDMPGGSYQRLHTYLCHVIAEGNYVVLHCYQQWPGDRDWPASTSFGWMRVARSSSTGMCSSPSPSSPPTTIPCSDTRHARSSVQQSYQVAASSRAFARPGR